MRRSLRVVVAVIAVVVVAWLLWPKKNDQGNARFFADQTYYFEAIRVLTDTGPAGGDTGEASEAINRIKSGDADGWYAAWDAEGDRVSALAATIHDPFSRGDALLRAHVYYRSAEFFLDPHDPRRPESWKKNVGAFYSGLDALSVRYERINVPYGQQHHLNAVYYPGPARSETKPLLVVVNGYDGTMEELYTQVVVPAYRRGYSVLTYEGPGQGAVLREQGLTMTPEWEKPTSALLDTFLAGHAKPVHMVIMGVSLGGYFAPRAAAFEPRIEGVIAFDEYFDGYAVASRHVPGFAFTLHLEQVEQFKQSLTHARSVTAVVYDRASGGAEHCQVGAPSLWQATVFDWLAAKFGSGSSAGGGPAPANAGATIKP